jgi:hypothetical protein
MGRPSTANKNRLAEAQTLARELLNDPLYKERLKLRLMSGDLPPALETMLYHYAFGKPVEVVAIEDNRDLEKMTDEELLETERSLKALADKVTTVN